MRRRPLFALAGFTIALLPSATIALQAQTGGASAAHLGSVSFPVSCSSSLQSEFNRAVALLHSFQYEAAQKAFQGIAHADPHCAMAHWGEAMTLYHQLWDWPNAKTIRKGSDEVRKAEKLHAKTERERDHIAAVKVFFNSDTRLEYYALARAYSGAMARLCEKYPDDTDAAALYSLSLLASETSQDAARSNRRKALAILEKLFAAQPNHPGAAHYLIHAADRPEFAERGLAAARAYAKIAPDSSHALHMPSHIFTRLGLWQDSIESNLAAAASAARATREHMGDAGYQTHAMDFLHYAYLQSGQEEKARELANELSSVPGASAEAVRSNAADFGARYEMELHRWGDAAKLAAPAGGSSWTFALTSWARVIGLARSGQASAAQKEFAESQTKIGGDSKLFHEKEQQAWISFAQGDKDAALQKMRAAAEHQEAGGELSFYPPAREMLADMLFELGRPAEALAEYESSLKFSPNRFDSIYGAARAAAAAGNAEKAVAYYSQLLRNCDGGAHSARPELAGARNFLAHQGAAAGSRAALRSPSQKAR